MITLFDLCVTQMVSLTPEFSEQDILVEQDTLVWYLTLSLSFLMPLMAAAHATLITNPNAG